MKNILLTILPYWDPMIPPAGIASLKTYLEAENYNVLTMDFIVEKYSLDFYNDYFRCLKSGIPKEKWGNFYNIGHDVLQNQMMAHLNYTSENKYKSLIKLLIYKHFYVQVEEIIVKSLINIVANFYHALEDNFLSVLESFRPEVIGATVYKCTLPSTIFAFRLVKRKYPNIKTIIGGGIFNESVATDSPNFDRLLKYSEDCIDKIIMGQGELLFSKYLRGELSESSRVYSKEDIDNRILQFSELGIPNYSDFNTMKYPYLPATASASCMYDCSFCVAKNISGKYRVRDPKMTVDEMDYLHEKYGQQLFFMTDSLINPVLDNLSRELIKKDKSYYYDAYFKVDKAAENIENTLLWRRGGLYRVRMGTESASQKILDAMNKNITVEQIKNNLLALSYAGIKTTTYWVIGHPDETDGDFQETLDLVEEMKNHIFQAESNYFLYHYSKQNKSDEWAKYREPLYPEEFDELLVFKFWTLKKSPVREVAFERVHKFEEHCRKLGIPNPYSIGEHEKADIRWNKLQDNAVPPIISFIKNEYQNENKNLKVKFNSPEISPKTINFDF